MPLIVSCSRCQAPHDETDRFCSACGTPLQEDARPVPATESRAVVPWRGPMPGIVQGMVLAGGGLALRFALAKAIPMMARVAMRRAVGRRVRQGPSRGRLPVVQQPDYIIEQYTVRRVRFFR
ncbi:MAG TPA: zinc ribbon domain-containing protein [Dehalococcoidia bacterium]|nr:zinc ribbon domain-containing protein [Dehalococcoidia bacterium]